MNEPQFIIVAGVNGAGKSTLYMDNQELFIDTKRVNADEILRQQHGDWRNATDNLHAMRIELKMIRTYLVQKQSFHMETTLAGNGRTQRDLIAQSHEQGFSVTLLYIGVPSPQIAMNRVHQRVAKGGHGIPNDLILKRFQQSLNNLSAIARIVDDVKIYTNDQQFALVYAREQAHVLLDNLSVESWLPSAESFML